MGEMHKPFYALERADLQVVVESVQPGTGMAWPTLFPLRYSPRFDIKALEGEDGLPVTADRVSFNSRAPKKTRKTIGSWSGKLGKMAVSRVRDEEEINEYNELTTLANASNDPAAANNLLNIVYDDVTFCSRAMDARVELDALRIGSSGEFVGSTQYDGDMVKADIIDFNIPSAHKGGVTTAWSNTSTADGLGDIARWAKKIKKEGRRAPQYAFMAREAFDELSAQEKTAKRLFPLTTDVSLVTGEMLSLEAINDYQRKNNYPQIVVIDSYVNVEDKDGNETSVQPWDVEVVVLSPEPRLGYTYYKPVPDVENTDALQAQGSYYKTTRYSELNPMQEVTMAEAYYQPALSNRKSLVFFNTTKSTW